MHLHVGHPHSLAPIPRHYDSSASDFDGTLRPCASQ